MAKKILSQDFNFTNATIINNTISFASVRLTIILTSKWPDENKIGIKASLSGTPSASTPITSTKSFHLNVYEAETFDGETLNSHSITIPIEPNKTYWISNEVVINYPVRLNTYFLMQCFDGLSGNKYAIGNWKREYYILTLSTDGHGTATATSTQAIYGSTATLKATPFSGYIFSHWEASNGISSANLYQNPTTFSFNEDSYVKAHFKLPETLSAPANPWHGSTNAYRSGSSDNIIYHWDAVTNASSYTVRVYGIGGTYNDNEGNYWEYKNITGTQYKDEFGNIRVGNSYYFKVQAIGSGNYSSSGWSKSNSFRVNGYYELYDINKTLYYTSNGIEAFTKGISAKPVTNKTFAYWGDASGNEYTTNITLTSNNTPLKAYAYYTDNEYELTLKGNGGKFGTATEKKLTTSNKKIKLDQRPTRDNYVFRGWATNDTATSPNSNYPPDGTIILSSNLTLYAVWGNESTISFDLNAPTIVGSNPVTAFTTSPTTISPITKTYGQAITLPVMPICTGFKFKGWKNGSTTYDAGAAYNVEGSATLQAQWENNKYSWSEIAPSFGPPLLAIDLIEQWWEFNTTITLRPVWSTSDYDPDKWRPADNFWKVTNGTNTIGSFAPGATFYYNNQDWAKHGNKIQSQWTQVTNWRGAFGDNGGLWIYIGNPGEEG